MKLLGIWGESFWTNPPKSLGGKGFDKLITVYDDGGFDAVEKLLAGVSVSPAMQANAWTALARYLIKKDCRRAAEAARRAYKQDPKPYRLKWLAFRLFDAGNIIEAEVMLDLLPPGMSFSNSEARQVDELRRAAGETTGFVKSEKETKRVDFDLTRSYSLPSILTESDELKTYEIVCITFRKHDPKAGLTGGPNGVLNVQRDVFGERYRGFAMRYIFQPGGEIEYPQHLLKALTGLDFMVKLNFFAAYFVEYFTAIWSRRTRTTEMFFICHDIGSAYGAFLRGCKYVIIWHTQGSLAHERESFGAVFTERDKHLLDRLEEDVLYNAESVYFPSSGAKDSFVATTNIDCSKIRFGEPLYNTIPDAEPIKDIEAKLSKLGIINVNKDETDIFLSVGDFSENKGMERVPLFLKRYAEHTDRKVYWIAVGSRHKAGIYERLVDEKASWNFEATLIGERTDHNTLLALMEYSDYYIMLHRHSIFDFSTLEAMRAANGLILTPVGGNLEVNKNNNAIFVDLDNIESAVDSLLSTDKTDFGKRSVEAFETCFSKDNFFHSYGRMIDEHLSHIISRRLSSINKLNLSPYKNLFKGETAIICGAGSSLSNYSPMYGEKIKHFALNSALFCWNIRFDYLFMQDYPKNQKFGIDDYNRYDCVKFYGKITNAGTREMGLNIDEFDLDNIKNNIIQYELMHRWFDARVDVPEFELDEYCLTDAQSVLFSAIQFAVYAGFDRIVLYGIDFSGLNFGNLKNPNLYNNSVGGNLIAFKKYIKEKLPEVEFFIGSTTNGEVYKAFNEIDHNVIETRKTSTSTF
jgi:glycosyltransferase involved in cell wall biosynthesis